MTGPHVHIGQEAASGKPAGDQEAHAEAGRASDGTSQHLSSKPQPPRPSVARSIRLSTELRSGRRGVQPGEIVESLPFPAAVVTPAGILLQANDLFLAARGLSAGDARGWPIVELLSAERGDLDAPEKGIEAAALGRSVRAEWGVTDRDGAARVLDVRLAPLRDRLRNITRILFLEIGSREIVPEARLMDGHAPIRVAEMGRDPAAHGAVHDIRNLLSVALASLQMLESEITSKRGRGIVLEATEAVRLGEELARRLRGPASSSAHHKQIVALEYLLPGTLDLLRRTLNPGVTIDLAISPQAVPVAVDPVGLRSTLLNLVLNARDAMPNGGRIIIEAVPAVVLLGGRTPGVREMLVSVTDTGTGIPDKIRQRAIEPFVSGKSHDQGAGLGLAQVHEFVKQNGGHLEVDSQIGVGTTVRLYLQAASSQRKRNRPGEFTML